MGYFASLARHEILNEFYDGEILYVTPKGNDVSQQSLQLYICEIPENKDQNSFVLMQKNNDWIWKESECDLIDLFYNWDWYKWKVENGKS